MREMLAARDDRDFVVAGPRSPGGRPMPRREPGSMQLHRPGRRPNPMVAVIVAVAGVVRRRFGLVAAVGLAGAGGVAVCVNALSLQAGRHPAPIFSAAEPVRPVRVQPPAEAAKAAAPAPLASIAAQTGSITAPPVTVPTPPRRAADAAPPRAAARDAIGDMIRATDPAAPAGRADRSVAFAQRALTKLGYGQIKADGVMGTGTKAAIERFERDQKLAVTGEASGRTLRDLAQRSGLAPE